MDQENRTSKFKKALKENIGYILICIFIIAGSVAKDYSIKHFQNKEWSFGSLNKDAKRNSKINEIIYSLRENLQADCVTIFTFHNGGFFSSGIPYRKQSPTYEVYSYKNRNPYRYENTPLSQVSELIKNLTEKSEAFEIVTSTLPESTLKSMSLNNNYKKNIYKRIKIGEKMIGYIQVSFLEENAEVLKDDYKSISESGEIISSLMAEKDVDLF